MSPRVKSKELSLIYIRNVQNTMTFYIMVFPHTFCTDVQDITCHTQNISCCDSRKVFNPFQIFFFRYHGTSVTVLPLRFPGKLFCGKFSYCNNSQNSYIFNDLITIIRKIHTSQLFAQNKPTNPLFLIIFPPLICLFELQTLLLIHVLLNLTYFGKDGYCYFIDYRGTKHT